MRVTVIGAGLAGCEAALGLAAHGIGVDLYEQRPAVRTPAHETDLFAELVCSNSLKSDRLDSASGLLKAEMRMLGSAVLQVAECCQVPAGGALAVDRQKFAQAMTARIQAEQGITVHRQEVQRIPEGTVVVATGPLTAGALAEDIARRTGQAALSFYDAAAPIIEGDSIDRTIAFPASRYGKGGDDYLNCPFTKEQYELFYEALSGAERAELHDFEAVDRVYEGCMPVEVMAQRGIDTLRFGPLRPVGLCAPGTCRRPWANLQLRREDAQGTRYNLVGFQTNLKFSEQKRVFRLIPGLANAEFVRYGVMHRNTFLNSPLCLAPTLHLQNDRNVYFAGQITGTEGYMESALGGILAARFIAARAARRVPTLPPPDTMSGGLMRYVTTPLKDFQPMGAAMGLLPPLADRERDKRLRYEKVSARALASLQQYLDTPLDTY